MIQGGCTCCMDFPATPRPSQDQKLGNLQYENFVTGRPKTMSLTIWSSKIPSRQTQSKPQTWKSAFFFLHCRTSARLGRSTTGVSLWLKTNFPKERNQKPTQPNKQQQQPTHTGQGESQAKVREICKLSETKWNMRAPLSPSNVLVHLVVLLHIVQ